jgi:hypothetical protein
VLATFIGPNSRALHVRKRAIGNQTFPHCCPKKLFGPATDPANGIVSQGLSQTNSKIIGIASV